MGGQNDLLNELNRRSVESRQKARNLEYGVDVCWWTSVITAGLASVSGLIPLAPYLPLPSWAISLFAAVASGAELLRRNAKWREKSNAYYAFADAAQNLSYRLEYEIKSPATADQVASISKELRIIQDQLGNRLSKINQARDDRSKDNTSS